MLWYDTNYWHLGYQRKEKVLSAWIGSIELSMSSSSFKCCSNLSTFEPSSCGARGVPFLMEMCQGIWNWEKLLCAIHALAHSASEHVTVIKKRERNCTELADVTDSLLALAGICSRRASWWITGWLLAKVPPHSAMPGKARAQRQEHGEWGSVRDLGLWAFVR